MATITNTVGRRYAEALADLTHDLSEEERANIRGDLEALREAVRTSTDLGHVFANPSMGGDQRQAVLDAILEAMKVHTLSRRFVGLLSERGRLPELEAVVASYCALDDARLGRREGRIVSATELPEEAVQKIRKALEERVGGSIELTVTVDPALIGGVRAEVGSMVFDGSIRAELDRLGERLTNPRASA
ncbi:MAG: ATP synthase F1 subunit delta [Myxococcota bacterium]